ncbi:unnamed protein product [Schistosoma margrebowiei]|uniref:Galectin domain-containing protein n=1 Tax=Schistosoma margrebowiei TaxID=48269 RepID=A0AA84ZHP0_9TREM|nr:unnamed protein product [Schistosoma margrebowiei]
MNESFDDQDTEFTYEIPDCLMDGDYVEIHGVCHGKRIVFELLTEEASTQNIFDKLPLQIILTTDGLVTVISRNPEKVAKQERSVENGIQIDKAFELCVHAYKKCYVVKLNGEDVCGQDHLVPLNEAFALSMQGKVDILSLEFKDMYYDEEEMNNNTNMSSANNNSNSIRMDDAQAGLVRVNELRQSSIRRNDPPVMVPTRTGSKLEKQSIKNQTPSVSSDLAFTRNTIHPAINVAVTERLPKEMSKKPAPEIAAYLHKSNPSAEFDTLNLTGREILSEDTHFAPFDRKHYDGYENVGSSYDTFKHKTLSDSRKSIEISSLSDLHSQGKLKGPAPELAALIHSKHPTSNLEDITIAQGSGSHIRPFTPTDHSPKQSRYHNEPPSDIANLKLKGTAPEIAAIINSRTKSPNHEDVTLTQRCDQNFHPYPTVDTSGKKPFKPSGSASEIAADIHKNNLADHRPYADYTLTGTNTNEMHVKKYVLKEKVQSTRKALSLSEHISDGDETESGGSEVYTDNECYLEVGKSEYYFDRKRSLRNYRSKRSTKLEREARRNMGLHRNDSQESVSSSISSLKPTDRKLTPKYRKRPGTKKEEVSSWLSSSNSPYNPIRIDGHVYPNYTSNVYASAPIVHKHLIQNYLSKDIIQSIKCDSSINLPHPLTVGRSALVYGHFKYNSAVRQSCLIKLEFNTSCEEANEYETLYLQLWSDGSLDILNSQSINSKIPYSSSNDIQYLTLKDNEVCNNDKQQVNFTLNFISQSFYTAITSNDQFTLILKNQFLKSANYHLKSFKLEDSTNAKLDKLFMPKNLCLPLILHMKDVSSQTNTLNLLTKLTADTKRVIIEYVYKPISSSKFISMQILLNFETSYLIIQEIAKETNNIQYADKEITYIPEQICKMKFSWYNNTLKVLLNNDESMMYNFEQYYPLQFLSHIRINGDFMLLNAELQSDE